MYSDKRHFKSEINNQMNIMEGQEKQVKIFYSYSHKDEELREKFEAHMSGLKRTGFIEDWHDRKILAGQSWEKLISEQIYLSDIVLFLVSSDFLNSDYCYHKEVIKSVERHYQKKCIVVPIIIRDCDWEGTPFEGIQGLPTDMKPVISRHWHNIDEAFTDVAKGLKKIIKSKYQELQNAQLIIREQKNSSTPPNVIAIILRNSITGEEFDIECPIYKTLGDIIDELLHSGIIDNKSTYQIFNKNSAKTLEMDQTLKENNINNGDTLLLIVKSYAG
ncbi:MAG: toll/interleukin-1 receptor domain-containing protein [Elusimicrobiota bacterium]